MNTPSNIVRLPQGQGRALPQDAQAERGILGAAMLDCSMVDELRLTADDFYREAHQRIWAMMAKLRKERGFFDLLTFIEAIHHSPEPYGGLAYVSSLADEAPTTFAAPHWARIVSEHAQRRRLVFAALEMQDAALDTSRPLDEVREVAERSGSIASQHGASDGWSAMEIMAERYYRTLLHRRAERDRGAVPGLPSPWRALDGRINAGRGDVIIIGARPGMGKSALALEWISHIARNVGPVAVISLEMPEPKVMDRLVTADSGVFKSKLERADWNDGDWADIGRSLERMSGLPVLLSDNPGLSAKNLVAHVKRAQWRAEREFGRPLAGIVLDYLQLVKATGYSREQEVAGISRSLKADVAMGLNVMVLALSQLNRSCEDTKDKRPALSHLRESGSIEQDADVVILPYRRAAYPELAKDCDEGLMEAIVAKARNGVQGSTWLRWDGRVQRIVEDERQGQGPERWDGGGW